MNGERWKRNVELIKQDTCDIIMKRDNIHHRQEITSPLLSVFVLRERERESVVKVCNFVTEKCWIESENVLQNACDASAKNIIIQVKLDKLSERETRIATIREVECALSPHDVACASTSAAKQEEDQSDWEEEE